MTTTRLSTLLLCGTLAALPATFTACSEDPAPGGGGSGGTPGTGGARTGGSSGSGGTTGSGGAVGTGGSTGSGGSTGTGGSTGAGGSSGDAAAETGGDAPATETGGSSDAPAGDGGAGTMSFFVTSQKNMTGNLGGLAGADKRCKDLADAAGVTGKTWAAYLSTEKGGPGDGPIHAKDRIGTGPWYNAKGMLVANNVTELHARKGDANLFLDERGMKINGQWGGSPTPNEHDILTGTKADGTVYPAQTCADWTSEAAGMTAWVGHSDGLGPNMNASGNFASWNASHENGGCNNTSPRGGAGRIYCFAK